MQVPSAMQVSHVKVLERVSLILKNHGLFPTGDCIDTGNLYFFSIFFIIIFLHTNTQFSCVHQIFSPICSCSCPYEQQLSRSSSKELPDKHDTYATAEKVRYSKTLIKYLLAWVKYVNLFAKTI
jgi:hypothetical protein